MPHELAVERMERLVEVVQRRARERAQRFVGRTLEVLVEGTSRTDPTRLRGRSRHNKAVNFSGLAAPGDLVAVQVADLPSSDLEGELSAPTGPGQHTRPRRDLLGDPLARPLSVRHLDPLGVSRKNQLPGVNDNYAGSISQSARPASDESGSPARVHTGARRMREAHLSLNAV